MHSTHVDEPKAAEGRLAPQGEELILPLYVEDVEVSRRKVETSVVRVATVTRTRDHLVDERLNHERIVIEHVPIGTYVDSVPAVCEEGDLTIMPVVVEVVVVERKLLLREEVHIRRVRTTEQHVETVRLREQEAVVTRIPASERSAPTPTQTPPPTLESDQ